MLDKAMDDYILKFDKEYPDLISEKEVAEILGFNEIYFRNLRIRKKLIPFLKISGKVLYLKGDIKEFIKNQRKGFQNVN